MARSLRDLMTRFSVVGVDPGASVREAAKTMADNHVGAIVVFDNDAMVGIFSERDLLVRVVAQGLDADAATVRDVMTANVVTLGPDASALDALRLMSQVGIRHLVVEEGGAVLGVVSLRDFVGAELQMVDGRWQRGDDSADA